MLGRFENFSECFVDKVSQKWKEEPADGTGPREASREDRRKRAFLCHKVVEDIGIGPAQVGAFERGLRLASQAQSAGFSSFAWGWHLGGRWL